ncbi:hypothetical protein BCR34DRAFT_569406 [Clohesyomyces aquaticus]|uniref:Uncharacterized protein n=1 Tax=Clohesyomyces aquaticus TaxID=1231657 RepID=A0A1Y1ZET9_9PLEO|nr:hypothetical protein BCR34DRAFT_569406 [Clohesyomyces aquaticus]
MVYRVNWLWPLASWGSTAHLEGRVIATKVCVDAGRAPSWPLLCCRFSAPSLMLAPSWPCVASSASDACAVVLATDAVVSLPPC